MASTYDNSVLDFDLNFLRETGNTTLEPTKTKKQYLALKQKVVSSSSLIHKYYECKESFKRKESELVAAIEECKQICIDYKTKLDKCNHLEHDNQLLRLKILQLEEKTSTTENRQEAEKSYINQLQLLVQDRESVIQNLKLENNLHKTNNSRLQKGIRKQKNATAKNLYNIAQMVFRKKPLCKKSKFFLMKYIKSNKNREEFKSEANSSGSEAEDSDDAPASTIVDFDGDEKDHADDDIPSTQESFDKSLDKRNCQDSEIFGESASIDTGRGSSLAFSDSDKCAHSPEYYLTDSPLSEETSSNKKLASPITAQQSIEVAASQTIFAEDTSHLAIEKRTNMYATKDAFIITNDKELSLEILAQKKLADSSKSPITVKESVEVATSPIVFEEPSLLPTNTKKTNMLNVKDAFIIPKVLIDKGTSPIKSNMSLKHSQGHCNTESPNEQECLAINSSLNFHGDNSDGEIEMILNTMRLSDVPITPIPPTPAKSVEPKTNGDLTSVVVKILEENKITQRGMEDIKKALKSIQTYLGMGLHKNNNNKKCESNVFNEESIQDSTYNSEQHCLPDDGMVSDEENLITLEDLNCNPLQSVQSFHGITPITEEDAQKENDRSSVFSIPNSPICEIPTLTSSECFAVPKSPICEIPVLNSSESFALTKSPIYEIPTLNTAERLHFEQDIDSVVVEDDNSENICNNLELGNNIDQKKAQKATKLTRLGKLRKSMLPKSKIKNAEQPRSRNLRARVKQLFTTNETRTNKNTVTLLNNKDAYEKAVKVMADLKEKEKRGHIKTSKSNQKHLVTPEIILEHNKEKQNRNNPVDLADKSNVGTENMTKTDKSPESTMIRTKRLSFDKDVVILLSRVEIDEKVNNVRKNAETESTEIKVDVKNRKRSKCSSYVKPETEFIRVLRSSTARDINIDDETDNKTSKSKNNYKHEGLESPIVSSPKDINQTECQKANIQNKLINYSDIDMFNDDEPSAKKKKEYQEMISAKGIQSPHDSVLCKMIEKYGSHTIKHHPKKVSDNVVSSICKKIDNSIANIIELPPSETKSAMNKLVEEIQKLKLKEFLPGLMMYLKDPQRKMELLNKINIHPAPPMTKSEQVLLYVVTRLKGCWHVDIINCVLNQIEYTLFKLNNTPDFQIIESMSHFYAVLCRYIKAKSRLRMFVLDAMYCIQFKAVPLIKQCMEVWMHILPLAHMGIAKSPMVTCLVYLLHFYKCEDKYNRVQEIRTILNQRYFFKPADWNETRIIEMFKNAIKELKDSPVDEKMLRVALILLAKRHGPRWCQSKIVQNVLQPLLGSKDVSDRSKLFCVSMLGPLLKPYPMDMKVHCEIILNQLIDMLHQNQSPLMEEAIFTSLINMSKHNSTRVIEALLSWRTKEVSPELETLMRDFVKEKPVRVWKTILSKVSLA